MPSAVIVASHNRHEWDEETHPPFITGKIPGIKDVSRGKSFFVPAYKR